MIDGRVHPGTTLSPGDLIGRARECRAIEELLDAVREGRSQVLVLRGDAGMGKSALVHHLVTSAAGYRVVHASGVESEMHLPFAALHQLCAPMLESLDALPDPQRGAASTAFGLTAGRSPDRLLIGLAVLNLLSGAAEEKPLLCVIDDAHWLDRESIDALTFVARRLLADHVALVFSTRGASADLAEFDELAVEGLKDGDAQTLLSSVLHVSIDERVRDRIVAETLGNPLALVEWPRGRTAAELAGGFGMPASMPIASQIEQSFRDRVGELPTPTQRFLILAAAETTGDPVVVWRAASGLGLAPIDASPALDAGLVEMGTRVWFRHPLVRTAVYGSATREDRQAAHRALADATDVDADPDRRAWHRALGSPGPDEEIADLLVHSAGRARARGGLAAAAALLERAVVLTVDSSQRTERIIAAAAAHLDAGSFDIADGLFALAETAPLDDMSRAVLDALRAQHAVTGGDIRDAPELFLRAAKCFEPIDVGLAQQTYLGALAAAPVAGTFSRAVTMHDVARAASECPISASPNTRELLVTALARTTLEGPASAAPTLRRALEQTAFETLATESFHSLSFLTAAAATLWDNHSLHQLATLQVSATRELGALTMLPWALNTLAHILTFEGDLDGAALVVAEADEIVEVTGGNVQWAGAILAGWRGDSGSLASIDKIASRAHVAGNALALKSALWGSACFHNGAGHYERALADASEADRQPWEWGAPNYFSELIEAAARCGQPAVARAQLERLAETVEPSGSDWGLGVYARSHALLTDGRAAEDLYLEAIECLRRSAILPELARAHLLFGEWLRRENRRVDARAQLRIAHAMLTAMGIHGFAERARHELLATGETVRRRTVDSFDELTSQEANIARLAAEGRTNPEIGTLLFISPRTVEWHMRKVFTKVGVSSRRELRDALPRQAARLPLPT